MGLRIAPMNRTYLMVLVDNGIYGEDCRIWNTLRGVPCRTNKYFEVGGKKEKPIF